MVLFLMRNEDVTLNSKHADKLLVSYNGPNKCIYLCKKGGGGKTRNKGMG